MVFAQLLTALGTLFKSYDELKLSLARLSEKVMNTRVDPRGQAAKINAFLKDTRSNLSFYLKSLERMSAAIMQEQGDSIKKANTQARFAHHTMTKLKEHTEAKGMVEVLEAVIDELRKQEENQSESDGDDNKIIENILQGASTLVQGITWGLFRYIKEEMRKALDDSVKFFTKANALDDEVRKVKESIAQLQSACSDNISALETIMKELCQDGKDDEGFSKSFKSSAEALGKSCGGKLPSFKSE